MVKHITFSIYIIFTVILQHQGSKEPLVSNQKSKVIFITITDIAPSYNS